MSLQYLQRLQTELYRFATMLKPSKRPVMESPGLLKVIKCHRLTSRKRYCNMAVNLTHKQDTTHRIIANRASMNFKLVKLISIFFSYLMCVNLLEQHCMLKFTSF